MITDQRLTAYKEALLLEQQQRKSDNADKQSEISNWQTISETLSGQVATQQTYLSDFDRLLGVTSGSEADKHTQALQVLDSIQKGVKQVESENFWLKVGLAGGGVALVVTTLIAILK